MSDRWAPLDGWEPDPKRPGYLRHPNYHPDTRRDAEGHWYGLDFIDWPERRSKKPRRPPRAVFPPLLRTWRRMRTT